MLELRETLQVHAEGEASVGHHSHGFQRSTSLVMTAGLISTQTSLFAQEIWPILAATPAELAQCYCADNGRAGIEPVLLLGVLVFQFMERVPGRAAVEMVRYYLGWKLALNVALQDRGFHATTLVGFRERLIEHEQGDLAFAAVFGALVEEGFVPKKGKQRLSSTHVLGVIANMSSLECVRETLRLALGELERQLPVG